jgi:rod shape-determining protein MreB
VAVGARARKEESRTVQVVNPFVHPRTLLADFDAGQQLLRTLLRQLRGRSLFAAAPRLLLHLQDDPVGGFTAVEVRAFREMGLGAGAAHVLVWQGPNLTDEQLRARQLPKEGRILSS